MKTIIASIALLAVLSGCAQDQGWPSSVKIPDQWISRGLWPFHALNEKFQMGQGQESLESTIMGPPKDMRFTGVSYVHEPFDRVEFYYAEGVGLCGMIGRLEVNEYSRGKYRRYDADAESWADWFAAEFSRRFSKPKPTTLKEYRTRAVRIWEMQNHPSNIQRVVITSAPYWSYSGFGPDKAELDDGLVTFEYLFANIDDCMRKGDVPAPRQFDFLD